MRILMQVWLEKKIRLLKTNEEVVPLLYQTHHRAHHRITPNQWTLRRATRKNTTMTKICPKHYYGTVTAPILMYTIIQLKQKNLSSCRFANTTPLQLQRIVITKMRRHWKRQALKKVVLDATTTCPSSVLPVESGRARPAYQSVQSTGATPSPPWDPRCIMCAYIISMCSSCMDCVWCLL